MNQEQYTRLVQDVASWNAWREESPKEIIDLRWADLRGATLFKADLSGADLFKADLSGADLFKADLRGADLREADLTGATLFKADLRGATLTGAALDRIRIDYLTVGIHAAPTGALHFWKKAQCPKGTCIVRFWIAEETPRSCATTRKIRCDHADDVLEAPEGAYTEYCGVKTYYVVGEPVLSHNGYNPDRWVECGEGIHGFLTREEAEAWEG